METRCRICEFGFRIEIPAIPNPKSDIPNPYMSLQNVNEEAEEERAETVSGEQEENYRRVTEVFPLYSVILLACLAAVFACQAYANSQSQLPKEKDMSALLAGFVKQLFREGQY